MHDHAARMHGDISLHSRGYGRPWRTARGVQQMEWPAQRYGGVGLRLSPILSSPLAVRLSLVLCALYTVGMQLGSAQPAASPRGTCTRFGEESCDATPVLVVRGAWRVARGAARRHARARHCASLATDGKR